jgi:hypothetical protein
MAGLRGCAAATVLLMLSSACATRGFVPPSATPVPEPESAAIWQQVTERCRGVQLFQAEIRVRGRVGEARERFNPPAIHGAITRSQDIYLEVPTLAGTVLQMAGTAGEVTLLLPKDRRVLRAGTDEVFEGLTGLAWGPRELLDALSGCVTSSDAPVTGGRSGNLLHVVLSPTSEAWLEHRDGRWQLRAARVDTWMLEYRRHDVIWPAEIRVTATSPVPVDLVFTLHQVSTNIELPASAFSLEVPPGFEPMSLDELRAIGPLKDGGTQHPAPSTQHPALN